MTRDNARDQLITILKTVVTIPEDIDLNDQVSLRDDLGMDSLASLTFLMELEESIEHFTINPDNLEESHFQSIGAMADYIHTNVASAATA